MQFKFPILDLKHSRWRKMFRWILLSAMVLYYPLHIYKTYAPLSDFNDKLISKFDHEYLFQNAVNGWSFLQNEKRLWKYTPHYSGGECDEATAGSSKLPILFFALFPNTSPELIFNLVVFLSSLLAPLIYAIGVFLLGRSISQCVVAYLMCSFLLAGTTIGTEFIFVGHYGFILASVLGFVAYGLIFRYQKKGHWKYLLCYTLVFSVSIWIHPLSAIIFFILLGTHGMRTVRKLWPRKFIQCFLATLIAFLPNLLWIIPTAVYLLQGYRPSSMAVFLQSSMSEFLFYFVELFWLGLIAAFVITIVRKYRDEENDIKRMLLPTMALALISAFGSFLGLGDLQPIRFLLPLGLIIILEISRFYQWYWIILLFILSIRGNWIHSIYVGSGQRQGYYDLVHFVQRDMDHRYRLHIQDSKSLPYFDTRINYRFPILTGMSIMAPRYTYPQQFYHFLDDDIFGQKINQITIDDFEKYSHLYNIGYYLVFSSDAKLFFSKYEERFDKIYNRKGIMIFHYNKILPSYCYKCSAEIYLHANSIVVKGAKEKETTLKFHYGNYRGEMKIEPSLRFEPVKLLDDPTPFIRVYNGEVQDFTIFY